ncbi:hypothetical protein CDL15_Pgr013947 [Punica granatum]|uniref:Uncharacterized protein n=1 Tax=Punica granatum TaxID=22663 RepID=A0A218WA06_PUNGR|nr:hypothetical protein CDL15_Pgr013947 [Punica granatum]
MPLFFAFVYKRRLQSSKIDLHCSDCRMTSLESLSNFQLYPIVDNFNLATFLEHIRIETTSLFFAFVCLFRIPSAERNPMQQASPSLFLL